MSDPVPVELAQPLDASFERRRGFGDPLYYFTETGSTNDVAARLADQGASEGTTVVASAQTAGRGRLGRQWHSPADAGLYVSVIIRNPKAAAYVTLAGGVAVALGITRATGMPVEIKWPNDIVAPGTAAAVRRRKLAGILAEATSGPHGLAHIVLGFGINLRATAYPPEVADRASSIEVETGRPVEPGAVLAEALAALAEQMDRLSSDDPGAVLEEWRRLSPASHGSSVEVETASGRTAGRTAGIDDSGALLVRIGGSVERVISGEVVWT